MCAPVYLRMWTVGRCLVETWKKSPPPPPRPPYILNVLNSVWEGLGNEKTSESIIYSTQFFRFQRHPPPLSPFPTPSRPPGKFPVFTSHLDLVNKTCCIKHLSNQCCRRCEFWNVIIAAISSGRRFLPFFLKKRTETVRSNRQRGGRGWAHNKR